MPADVPANTLSYMIAGYVVIFGIMLVYLASLVVRNRNLRQDEETLEELEQKATRTDIDRVK
jgi:NhaP-type Na+/H+ and K+/H+ antiporter